MIISHAHRFILVKPRKTAGTSVELALSPYLMSGDLATSIEPEEEPLRRVVDGVAVGPVRGRVGLWPVRLRDHSPLTLALALLPEIADYRVVTICRNPWDRAVSQFFWSMRRSTIRKAAASDQHAAFRAYTHRWGPRTWLDRVYGRKRQRALASAPLYTVKGAVRADYVVRFEALADDVAGLGDFLGLGAAPSIDGIAAKSGLRAGGGAWMPFFDGPTRDLVARECAQEIALFGYDFEGNTIPRGPMLADLASMKD